MEKIMVQPRQHHFLKKESDDSDESDVYNVCIVLG
jgi:hypothetical protein